MLTINQRAKNLQFLNYSISNMSRAYYNFQRDFNCSMLDGIYGNETDTKLRQVISGIQYVIGAKQDGIVGQETISKLKNWQSKHGLIADRYMWC